MDTNPTFSAPGFSGRFAAPSNNVALLNKPRDVMMGEGDALLPSPTRRAGLDVRAIVPGANAEDVPSLGMQIMRSMQRDAEEKLTPTGQYNRVFVSTVRYRRFDELLNDSAFLAQQHMDAESWAAHMQAMYAHKRNAAGALAFPNGLAPDTQFAVAQMLYIAPATAQDYLAAQYTYYARNGGMPAHIVEDWRKYDTATIAAATNAGEIALSGVPKGR